MPRSNGRFFKPFAASPDHHLDVHNGDEYGLCRRYFLQRNALLLVPLVALNPRTAIAAQEESGSVLLKDQQESVTAGRTGNKPYAPLQALLPAARLKVWVDQAYDQAMELKHPLSNSEKLNISKDVNASDVEKEEQNLRNLSALLSNPPTLFRQDSVSSTTPTTSTTSLAQLNTRVSNVNKEEYKRNRQDLSLPDQLAAIFNQADVQRQWGILKYQELKRAQQDPFRAAFNFYTSQLTFADSYLFTSSSEDLKRRIRNDQMPTLSAVITSDLDLRDLYRNQFLTAIQDAEAEVNYQIRQLEKSNSVLEKTDVLELMEQAHVACNKWFDLIDPKDVQEALDVVLEEQKKQQ